MSDTRDETRRPASTILQALLTAAATAAAAGAAYSIYQQHQQASKLEEKFDAYLDKKQIWLDTAAQVVGTIPQILEGGTQLVYALQELDSVKSRAVNLAARIAEAKSKPTVSSNGTPPTVKKYSAKRSNINHPHGDDSV